MRTQDNTILHSNSKHLSALLYTMMFIFGVTLAIFVIFGVTLATVFVLDFPQGHHFCFVLFPCIQKTWPMFKFFDLPTGPSLIYVSYEYRIFLSSVRKTCKNRSITDCTTYYSFAFHICNHEIKLLVTKKRRKHSFHVYSVLMSQSLFVCDSRAARTPYVGYLYHKIVLKTTLFYV